MHHFESFVHLRSIDKSVRARSLLCNAIVIGCVVSFVLLLALATALARAASAAEPEVPAGLFFRVSDGPPAPSLTTSYPFDIITPGGPQRYLVFAQARQQRLAIAR